MSFLTMNWMFWVDTWAPRPYGNAVSYCNAASLANVLRDGKNDTVIESVRLAFGVFVTKHAIRASEVEPF